MTMSFALVLVGMQRKYFSGGPDPFWNADEILDNVIHVMELAVRQNIPVALLRQVGTEKSDAYRSHGAWQDIHETVTARFLDVPIFDFSDADCMYTPKLHGFLENLDVSRLALAGPWIDVISLAISESFDRKYNSVILSDCCSASSSILDKIGRRTAGIRNIPIMSAHSVFVPNANEE